MSAIPKDERGDRNSSGDAVMLGPADEFTAAEGVGFTAVEWTELAELHRSLVTGAVS